MNADKSSNCCTVGLAIILLLGTAIGQGITVSGTVYDEFGDPMIGLNVLLKEDPGQGTSTDLDGKYTIVVPSENTVLLFQYIGYKEQEVVVGAANEGLHVGGGIKDGDQTS